MTMCNINEHPCDCFDCKMASICHGKSLQFEMNQDRYYMAPWEPSYIICLVTMVNMGYHHGTNVMYHSSRIRGVSLL